MLSAPTLLSLPVILKEKTVASHKSTLDRADDANNETNYSRSFSPPVTHLRNISKY